MFNKYNFTYHETFPFFFSFTNPLGSRKGIAIGVLSMSKYLDSEFRFATTSFILKMNS